MSLCPGISSGENSYIRTTIPMTHTQNEGRDYLCSLRSLLSKCPSSLTLSLFSFHLICVYMKALGGLQRGSFPSSHRRLHHHSSSNKTNLSVPATTYPPFPLPPFQLTAGGSCLGRRGAGCTQKSVAQGHGELVVLKGIGHSSVRAVCRSEKGPCNGGCGGRVIEWWEDSQT